MGQNRILETRGAPLYIGDDLIEGVQQVNIPGPSSQRFPIGDVLDGVRRYSLDLPEPGVATAVIAFNPADPAHLKLLQYLKNNTLVKVTWWVVGKKVNGVNTKTGNPIGSATGTVTAGTGEGLFKWTSFSADQPRVGDILAADSKESLLVTKADYTTAKQITVQKITSGKAVGVPKAETTATEYTITQPAEQISFTGQISGLPMGGQQTVAAQMSINISGELTLTVGTPDIA